MTMEGENAWIEIKNHPSICIVRSVNKLKDANLSQTIRQYFLDIKFNYNRN